MRVLVVYCHPNETSFASALHQTVLKALRSGATRSLIWIYMLMASDP